MTEAAQKDTALALLQFCQEHQAEMLRVLKQAVEIESPSDNKAALDRCGQFLATEFERLGGKVTRYPQKEAGDHLKADFPGRAGSKPLLLLGHFDTVWRMGTLVGMTFGVEYGRVWGPGVLDMKAGIVIMMFALRALRSLNHGAHRAVTVLLDTDEEVGSAPGRPLVEATAKECEAVLVLEPAQGLSGCLKTARKGVGHYTIQVTGRAAHSGVDFEKGRSAIVELSRQILEVTKFTDLGRGITVNPGVIQGGTRTNVVAAEASVEVDIRIPRATHPHQLQHHFASLRTFDPDCSLKVSGGINRPPIERTAGTVRLFHMAQQQAKKLGITLQDAATALAPARHSTPSLAPPPLDGLGGVGEGAHATHESIVLEELPRRAALLASLIESV